jgi:hypothetical protein
MHVSSCRIVVVVGRTCMSVLCHPSPGAPRLRVACLNGGGGLLVSTASVFAFSKHIRFRYY